MCEPWIIGKSPYTFLYEVVIRARMELSSYNSTDCEACKRLRRNLTWYGEPPKCNKHSDGLITKVDV